VEVKGGSMTIRPKLIVVTSQYSIARIWQDCLESRQAISRRFVELNKTSRNGLVLGGYGSFCDELLNGDDIVLPSGDEASRQEEVIVDNVELNWNELFNFE